MTALCLMILLCIKSSFVMCEVASIDITTADHQQAPSNSDIFITLWFNSTIYQFTLSASSRAYTYHITTFNILGTSSCDYNNTEAKIMIENDGTDSIIVSGIVLYTTDGVFYGINGRCFDEALHQTQVWLYEKTYASFIMNNINCSMGVSNIWMCANNRKNDCEPYKQMLYFDETRPNQMITDSKWSDATTILPYIVTCPPSASTTGANIPLSTTATSTSASTATITPKPTSDPSETTLYIDTTQHVISTTTATVSDYISTASSATATATLTTVSYETYTTTVNKETDTITTSVLNSAVDTVATMISTAIDASKSLTTVISIIATDNIFISTISSVKQEDATHGSMMNKGAVAMWSVIGGCIGIITAVLYVLVVKTKRSQKRTTVDEQHMNRTISVTSTKTPVDDTEIKKKPPLNINNVQLEELSGVTRAAMKNDKMILRVVSTIKPPIAPQKRLKCAQCGAILAGEIDNVLCGNCDGNESGDDDDDDGMFGSYNMGTAHETVGE